MATFYREGPYGIIDLLDVVLLLTELAGHGRIYFSAQTTVPIETESGTGSYDIHFQVQYCFGNEHG